MTISVAERAELAAAVSDLLHDECTEQDVRRVMSTEDGFDRGLWRRLAAQGVTGLLVGTEYGGVGLGAAGGSRPSPEAAGAAQAPTTTSERCCRGWSTGRPSEPSH
ncbi:acyl-CoA dehydrogenase [Mycolicibacterium conceptionense]|uniref:Acyl-CoA dehydrogenase n=1 Tax=Mycolicibacterium conceptionense TaxID=451644 RepID=A0A0U1CYS5_9MYCO|nr:acyl-CoA dehydrogenase [Mycolicibacterium conceptionense]